LNTYGYTYDSAGRLTTVTQNNATTAVYTYDSNSNRLSYTGTGGTVNGTYDNQDRLTQYGNTTYSYTTNGELLSRTIDTQTTLYGYDVFGNLKTVTLPNGNLVEYVVDGQNRRVGKKINGAWLQKFLSLNDFKPIAELDGGNNIVSLFIYGTQSIVPDYMVKGGITYRFITDGLGSPRLVVDVATGNVIQRMDYDEFGKVILDTNPGFQPFGFAGGLYDQATGLVRFGARDYDADTGRWTAKDPVSFGTSDTNLYDYTVNDPINWIDPQGLWQMVLPGPKINVAVEQGYPSPPGEYVVDAHALPNPDVPGSNVWEKPGPQWRKVSVRDLSNRILNDPRFHRAKVVRLVACKTAGPYAQQLASILKKPVIAPTGKVNVMSNGKWSLEKQTGNQWNRYEPDPLYGVDF
jgi:RHS repeat-associated protein